MKNIYELEEAQEATGDNVLVIDALNLAFRWKHPPRATFAEQYVDMVKSVAKSYNAEKILVITDIGSSTYRKEIYPEYKADRKAKYADQTEEEYEEFQKFFQEFNRALELCRDKFCVIGYKGVEADDLAALIKQMSHDPNYNLITKDHIWMVSTDKDWDLLIDDKVSRWSYTQRKEYVKSDGVSADEIPFDILLDVKVIVGGKDNVAGIPGIGIKRAIALIEKYGDAFDIVESLPLPGTAQYIKKLNELGKEVILRNIELMDKTTYINEAVGTENVRDAINKIEEYLIS